MVWTYSDSFRWKFGLIIETLAYWDVPVFIMITGATLLDYRKRYSTKEFFKRRFFRTIIPFIVWSLIGLGYRISLGELKLQDFNIVNLTTMFLSGQIIGIYWFFPVIFGLYLSIPIISAIPENDRVRIFVYAAIYTFISYSVLPILLNMVGGTLDPGIQIPISSGFVIYILLGYLFSRLNFTKKSRIIIYIGGFLGWFIRFITMLLWSARDNRTNLAFSGYYAFPDVLESIAVFTFFRYRNFNFLNTPRISNKIHEIASSSLGIYLLHYFFVDYAPRIFSIDITSIQWRVLGTISIYIVCLISVQLIRRVPVLKYIVP
jgi:surface polysaccharide O-acyltransferase-like enzyme